MELMGWLFLTGAMLTTAAFLWYGIKFAIKRDIPTAKSLMFSSFVYLPLVWIFVFLDWMIL
jgi:protoheme IX farnesyltransferase